MEARGENVEIDCNMTMREIFDVMEWPYPLSFHCEMFQEIFPGNPDLGLCLRFDIEQSLVRDFIPFIGINLSSTYVGRILGD